MKHIILTIFALHFSIFTLSAAVPLRWTVETSRATPATFEAYQGETISLEASLQSYGKPLEAPSNYSLYWQTNGMGNAWWEAPCTSTPQHLNTSNTSNILRATWSPTNDVGAKVYNCFIGKPGTIYHAAFQLRLRPSPGVIPNELPLPQKVIDFANVTVLNPPWSGGGGGGGVDTNAVVDIIHKTVDGSARTLPPYLHYLEMDDTYPDAAAEWYAQADYSHGSCSSVRDGGFLSRNYDWNFDFMPEFVVRVPASTVPSASSPTGAGNRRFASIAVCNVGTNLTEADVVSGKWSKWYKALPGHAVDGINENGVACNINVVDGDPQTIGWHTNATSEAIHPLGAIRWILDHATNAQHGAEYIAENIRFPQGWAQNFHYMIADAEKTYIVENGTATDGDEYHESDEPVTMTNFQLSKFPWDGMGMERFGLLLGGANITNAWYTRAYRRETNPPWVSDLAEVIAYTNDIFDAWAAHDKEYFRGKTNNGIPWWQSVHTSIYDITNRTLRICVQEVDDWYVFAVDQANVEMADSVTKDGTDGVKSSGIWSAIWGTLAALPTGFSSLCDWCAAKLAEKRDLDDLKVYVRYSTWSFDGSRAEPTYAFSLIYEAETRRWFLMDGDSAIHVIEDSNGDEVHLDLMEGWVVANRTRYEVPQPTSDSLAKESQLPTDAEKAEWNGKQSKITASGVLRGDGSGGVSAATKSSTGGANADYRDPQDNTCHRTEFTEWVASGVSEGITLIGQPSIANHPSEEPTWTWWYREVASGTTRAYIVYPYDSNQNATELTFIEYDGLHPNFTATRSAVCISNETFVTPSYVTNAVSAAVSTKNPAFVAAVLDVQVASLSTNITAEVYVAATNACANLGIDPALIPGAGTTVTIGGLIVMLFSVVFWMRKKIFDNSGNVSEQFAADLLGKPVAISAVNSLIDAKIAPANADLETALNGEGN